MSAETLERAHILAESYGTRPSSFFPEASDPWVAFCLDEAALVVASHMTHKRKDTPKLDNDTPEGGLSLNGTFPIVSEPDW